MKFELRHTFACTADELWAVIMDPVYQRWVDVHAELTRELLEEQEQFGELRRNYRFIPDATLPPAFARAVGSDKLVYTQSQRWKLADKSMKWEVRPERMADRVRSRGDYTVRDRAKGECERRVSGEVTVTIPVLGRQIEKKIVDGILASYERTSAITVRWLDGERPDVT